MKERTFDAHVTACRILEKINPELKQKYKDILSNRFKKPHPVTRDTVKNLLFLILEKEFVGFTIPAKHRNEQKNWQVDLARKL